MAHKDALAITISTPTGTALSIDRIRELLDFVVLSLARGQREGFDTTSSEVTLRWWAAKAANAHE